MKRYITDNFGVNCYILNYQGECFLIDPGEYNKLIEDEIKKYNYKGILLTHGHLDHIDAIDKYIGPIYIHANDYDNLFDLSLSGYKFFNLKKNFNSEKLNIIKIYDNDKIKLGDSFINVIHTPGHTKGSVCYLFKDMLFTGDTLFKNSVGRTDLPGGNMNLLRKSVIKIIDNNKDYIKIYPGHDEFTNIKQEKNNNFYYLSFKK